MDQWLQRVQQAVTQKSVQDLINLFSIPKLSTPEQLKSEFINYFSLPLPQSLSSAVTQGLGANSEAKNFNKLCEAFLDLNNLRNIPNFTIVDVFDKYLPAAFGFNYAFDEYWLLPLAKQIYNVLVWLAFASDRYLLSIGMPPGKIKAACIPLDALRGKMFDRQPFPTTRKSGIIYAANQIFKCYLKLNNLSQLRKVLDYVFNHVLQDESLLETKFCKSERVTFYFYVGKFHLLQHNVPKALDYLSQSFRMCPSSAFKNKRLILRYLVISKMVMGQYPQVVNGEYPLLNKYSLVCFAPLITAVKHGNFSDFTSFISTQKYSLTHFHLYNIITWRCTLQLYRNIIKKVYIIASSLDNCGSFGFVTNSSSMTLDQDLNSASQGKPPRIVFQDIVNALRFSGDPQLSQPSENSSLNTIEEARTDYVISLLCRMAEAGFIKGNVVPASMCMVVSRKLAFPSVNTVMAKLAEKEGWWRPKGDSRQIVEEDDD